MPPLDVAALARLRKLVQAAQPEHGLPSRALIGHLAASVEAPRRVTIDFAAAEVLGQPLVVVEVPAEGSASVPSPDAPSPVWLALSVREREVAELLAAGLANKEIAARLFIAVGTVKDHVHQVLRKTGLPSRAAVAAAWRGR